MTASAHTALGIEQNGRRVVTVAQHRDGVCLRTPADLSFVALSTEDADHICRLIAEHAANHRLDAAASWPGTMRLVPVRPTARARPFREADDGRL